MLNEHVKPGNVVEIVSKNLADADERAAKTLRTKIYDILSEDMIKVTIPTIQGKLQLIATDEEYDIYFYTDSGLYQSTCFIAKRYRDNAIPVMDLEIQTNLRKYQRREYYRLNCMMEMKCHALDNEETDEYMKSGHYTGADARLPNAVMVDISGGGARFVSREKYEEGALSLFRFSLNQKEGIKEYSVIGKIISSEELRGGGRFENRAKFVDMENNDRESIIKYIFEEERRIRKTSQGMDKQGGK